MKIKVLGDLIFLSFVISLQDVTNSHNASILMPSLSADVQHCHDQLMIKISKTKLSPYIFFRFLNK